MQKCSIGGFLLFEYLRIQPLLAPIITVYLVVRCPHGAYIFNFGQQFFAVFQAHAEKRGRECVAEARVGTFDGNREKVFGGEFCVFIDYMVIFFPVYRVISQVCPACNKKNAVVYCYLFDYALI